MKIRHWIRTVEVEGKEFEVECYGVDYRTQESHWPPRNIFIFWHGLGQKGFATPSRLSTTRPHLFREVCCQFSQVYPEQVFISVGVEPIHPVGKKRPFFEDEAWAVIQALDLDAGEGTPSGEAPTAIRIVGYSTGGVMAGTLGCLLKAREIFLFGGAGLCDLRHGVPELAWRTHWAVYQIGLAVMAGPERLGLLQRIASLNAWQRLYQKTALQALWGLLNRVNPLHPDPRIAFSRLRSTWQDLSACTTFNPFFERLKAPVYVLWPTRDWLFPLAGLRRPLPHNIHITTCDGHHYMPGAEPELTVRKLLQWVKSHSLVENKHWIREVRVNGNDFRLEAYIVDHRRSERTWPPDHLTILCPGFGQERLSFPDRPPNLFSEVCSQFSQMQREQVFAIVAMDPIHVNNQKRPFFQDEAQVVLKGLELDSAGATGSGSSTRFKVVGYSAGSVLATTLGYLTGADEVFLFNGGGLCKMRFGLAQLTVRFLIESLRVGFDVKDGSQRLSLLRKMLSLKGWRALFRTRRIWQAFFGVLGRALISPLHVNPRIAFFRLRSFWQDLANCTHLHPLLTRLAVPVWVFWPTNDGIFSLNDLRGVTLPENVVLIPYQGHHYTPEVESAQVIRCVLERAVNNQLSASDHEAESGSVASQADC